MQPEKFISLSTLHITIYRCNICQLEQGKEDGTLRINIPTSTLLTYKALKDKKDKNIFCSKRN